MFQSILIFKYFAIAAVCAIPSNLKPTAETHPSKTGWNELLTTEGLFDDDINNIEYKSSDQFLILAQLENLLSHDENLHKIYLKYRQLFKNNEDATPARMTQFKKQLVKIAAHNQKANSGESTWWMGVNEFTDMTIDELQSMHWGLLLENSTATFPYVSTSGVAAPASLDYVAQKKVTAAKNQGECGACAIFASVAVLESAEAITRKLIYPSQYSVQELIDCASEGFCCEKGCPGVSVENALEYLKTQADTTWKEYPFTLPAKAGNCDKSNTERRVQVKSFSQYKDSTEDALKQLLADSGPVVAHMYASPELHSYGKGVYAGSECGSNPANHAVAIVGYGTENGSDYWLIKNSWGQVWGNQGFLRLARNGGSVCGILGSVYKVIN